MEANSIVAMLKEQLIFEVRLTHRKDNHVPVIIVKPVGLVNILAKFANEQSTDNIKYSF